MSGFFKNVLTLAVVFTALVIFRSIHILMCPQAYFDLCWVEKITVVDGALVFLILVAGYIIISGSGLILTAIRFAADYLIKKIRNF